MNANEAQIDKWHLFHDQKQYGPYRFSTLVEGVKRGYLNKEDLIWRPGWESWRLAQSVPGLFAPPEISPATKSETLPVDSFRALTPDIKHQTAPELYTEKRELRPTSGNYLVRHWRGDLSLPVSYWINGTLVSVAAYIASYILAASVDDNNLGAGLPIALALRHDHGLLPRTQPRAPQRQQPRRLCRSR